MAARALPLLLLLAVFAFGARLAQAQEENSRQIPLPLDLNAARVLPSRSDSIHLLADAAYYPALIGLIQNARQQIDLAMFLFKAPEKSRPAEIAAELIKAGKRGVKVRVILENSGYDEQLNEANRDTGKLLAQNGITVIFDPAGRTAHAKIVVIDRRYCLVGSHNLTQSALEHNKEFSLLIDSRPLARELLDYMETLVQKEKKKTP